MDFGKRIKALRQDRADLKAKSRGILATAMAEGRAITDEERATDDAIQAQLTALNDELARYEREQSQPAETVTTDAPGAAQSADGFQNFGEFLQAVATSGSPGKHMDPRLMAAATGLGSAIPSDGGFLVRKDWTTALLERVAQQSVLLPRCRRIPIGEGSDGLEAPYIDETSRVAGSRWGGVQIYWASEGSAVTNKQPKFGRHEIRLEELKGLCYASDRVLRDAVALEAMIGQSFADEFSFVIDDSIINGDGVGKPLGVLNAGCLVSVTKETNQTATTIVAENIEKMYSRMNARSRGNAAWFINQDIEPQLFSMAHAVGLGGVPVYMPANGLSAAPFGTLFGRPVIPIEQAATLGTVGDIIFADFSQYVVIEKGGLQSASSMHVRFIYDEMTFRFSYRINGQPTWKSSLTPYKGSNSTSPFVVVATRA